MRVLLSREATTGRGQEIAVRVRDLAPGHHELQFTALKNSPLGIVLAERLRWDAQVTATVELSWQTMPGQAEPQIELSRLLCWEILGVGGALPNS